MTTWIHIGNKVPSAFVNATHEHVRNFHPDAFSPDVVPLDNQDYPGSEELTLQLMGATVGNRRLAGNDSFARRMLAKYGIDPAPELPPGRTKVDPLADSEPVPAKWLGDPIADMDTRPLRKPLVGWDIA